MRGSPCLPPRLELLPTRPQALSISSMYSSAPPSLYRLSEGFAMNSRHIPFDLPLFLPESARNSLLLVSLCQGATCGDRQRSLRQIKILICGTSRSPLAGMFGDASEKGVRKRCQEPLLTDSFRSVTKPPFVMDDASVVTLVPHENGS